MKLLLVSVLILVASGCSFYEKTGNSYDDTKGDPNVQNVIRLVNFTAKLGCTLVRDEGTTNDLVNAKRAVVYSKAMLASDAPTTAAIQVVMDQFMPKGGKPYILLALDEVEDEFGESIIDKNSTAYFAVVQLVAGCDEALTSAIGN